MPQVVETACLRREVPVSTLRYLLTYPDWHLALAAAGGEWAADPPKQIRKEIELEWREAILRAKSREDELRYAQRGVVWLNDVLESDSSLAMDWLHARLSDSDLPLTIDERSPFAAAVGVLSDEQKVLLLDEVEPLPETHRIFVGNLFELMSWSARVYRSLLASEKLCGHHLRPLRGKPPDEAWGTLAKLALAAGHLPETVAEHSFYFTGAYSGHGVEHWGKWEAAFAEMEKTAEGPLLEVAQHGLRLARERVAKAREEKRQYELTGRF